MRKKFFIIAICVLLVAVVCCLTACNSINKKHDQELVREELSKLKYEVVAYRIDLMRESNADSERYYTLNAVLRDRQSNEKLYLNGYVIINGKTVNIYA